MIHEFFVTLKNRHVEIALIVKKIDMALDKYEVNWFCQHNVLLFR